MKLVLLTDVELVLQVLIQLESNKPRQTKGSSPPDLLLKVDALVTAPVGARRLEPQDLAPDLFEAPPEGHVPCIGKHTVVLIGPRCAIPGTRVENSCHRSLTLPGGRNLVGKDPTLSAKDVSTYLQS